MSRVTALGLLFLSLSSTYIRAEEDGESFVHFESLVTELRQSADAPTTKRQDTSWEEVALHAGAGLTSSLINVTAPSGDRGTGLLKGLELFIGANLFTRVARAELLFRNYASEPLAPTLRADLREFELRFVYLPYFRDRMRLRLSAGLAARDMDLSTPGRRHVMSTPASSFAIGFERQLTPSVAISPGLAYRSAIISETFDKRSVDASVNLHATF